MEFSPNNPIVRRCLQGMHMEEKGKPEEASALFCQAWEAATEGFEKFLAAFYMARHQETITGQLKWLETSLAYALDSDSSYLKSALATVYLQIAACYEAWGDTDREKQYLDLALLNQHVVADKGPFYHGTKADLKPGDCLTAGGRSNYTEGLVMNHIYFTALVSGAGLAAALAKGAGAERIYIIEPTGHFENDPNVTDKKFPGNPSRSYRSEAPLKIIGEVEDWVRVTPTELALWREKLAGNKGKIIN